MPERPSILLISSGRIGACTAELLAEHASITTATTRDDSVAVAGYDCAALSVDRPYPMVADRLDAACHSVGVPWCGVTLLAHVAEIGPLVIPGQTPCHICWTRRRAAQAEDLDLSVLLDKMGCHSQGSWFVGESPALNRQAAALLVFEVLQLVHGRDAPPPTRMGDYWRLDSLSGECARHLYSPVAHCARCRAAYNPREGGHHLRAWAGL